MQLGLLLISYLKTLVRADKTMKHTSLKHLERNKVLVAKLCPTLCDPMDCSPPGSCVYGILQARTLERVVLPFFRVSSRPRDRTSICYGSCNSQAGSLPLAPPGKPNNTGAGSPSLLQGIFLTQEWNWGLRDSRWILYQLSYQGSLSSSTV